MRRTQESVSGGRAKETVLGDRANERILQNLKKSFEKWGRTPKAASEKPKNNEQMFSEMDAEKNKNTF